MSPEFEPDAESQQCPICHATYPVGIAVCAFCGSPLPMATGSAAAELHPPLPPPILPDTPESSQAAEAPTMRDIPPTPAATPTTAGQDGAPAEAATGPRWCAFCGWGSPPEAERCIVCGAAFPIREALVEQRAMLEMQ